MMCRCFRIGTPEKISDSSSTGDNDSSSGSSRLLISPLRFLSTGMETFQRTRASSSTCWNTFFFSFLIAFLRAPTDSLVAILTGKTWRGSSPRTKQLSSTVVEDMGAFVDVVSGRRGRRTMELLAVGLEWMLESVRLRWAMWLRSERCKDVQTGERRGHQRSRLVNMWLCLCP